MNTILVSVVVRAYNFENHIGYCLDSILKQKVDFNYEVLIGLDLSTDKTRQIIQSYTSKYPDIIRPIYWTNNIGAIRNHMELMDRVKGDYIAHLDGDDLMLPGKLQKQVSFLNNNADCSLVIHKCRIFESVTNQTLMYSNTEFVRSRYTLEDLIVKGNFIIHSSKMFRKSAVPIGGFKYYDNAMSLDYLWHIQSASFGKIGYIDEILGEYRRHEGGVSSVGGKHYLAHFYGVMRALQHAKRYGVNKHIVENAKHYYEYRYAWRYLRAGDYEKFIKLINRSGGSAYFNFHHRLLHVFRHSRPVLGVLKYITKLTKRF